MTRQSGMDRSNLTGKLLVFEGPDGVGKSTLAEWFGCYLQSLGASSTLLSFPGKEPGTLGLHVYEIHHDASKYGIDSIVPASLQLLHVAAHIDVIERRIKPLLMRGQTVILDRFWWSTFVYGLVGGVPQTILDAMIGLERAVWNPFVPDGLFLILRNEPLREEPAELWPRWRKEYVALARQEAAFHPIFVIDNDRNIQDAQQKISTFYAG